tara:strand:+ start:641 stop:808 length:168 start_codon:yes stop_codon:yes gene_type:complete
MKSKQHTYKIKGPALNKITEILGVKPTPEVLKFIKETIPKDKEKNNKNKSDVIDS